MQGKTEKHARKRILTLYKQPCEFLAQSRGEFQYPKCLEMFLQEVMAFPFPWQCWLCQIESSANHRWPTDSWEWTSGRKNLQTSRKLSFSRDCYKIVVREKERMTELTAGQEEKTIGCLKTGLHKIWEQLLKETCRCVATVYTSVWFFFFSQEKHCDTLCRVIFTESVSWGWSRLMRSRFENGKKSWSILSLVSFSPVFL